MFSVEKQEEFVRLRGLGLSYAKISEEIGVCVATLVKWSKKFANEISNGRVVELERLREEYMLSQEHRIKLLGTQLSQITQEILDRDLGEVPTWRLFYLQQKLLKEIARETPETVFAEETSSNGLDSLSNLFKRTEKWVG